MAKTKAGGSTRNGRDSHSKRLGAKLGDGRFATAGSIIYRQRGTKIHPGENVGRGGDDTLYSLIDGYIKYESKKIESMFLYIPKEVINFKNKHL
ncbi:50S ribosomal protein L27 [Mycoplasmopsis cynos]|nr:50S ribosomal protein L27 [Mycoplasmopsis cynos]